MSSPAHVPRPTDRLEDYKTLFDNLSEGVVVCEAIRNPDGELVDYWIRNANPVFLKRAPHGLLALNRRQRSLRPTTPAPWFHACQRALEGRAVRFEFQDSPSARWYEVHMARLSDMEFGQFFVDVTDRKRAEERQAQLFQELNHRVKNNLMIVSSLLELQARNSPPTVRQHLGKAVDRIRSIADLHAELYQDRRTDDADLRLYLETLCGRLAASLFAADQVRVTCDCEALVLSVEQAVTVGLIVNELVTNAAKHAFPENRKGSVKVRLWRGPEALRLAVCDDGQGFQNPAYTTERLGLRVVRSLAQSLGGDLQISEGSGAQIAVSLPLALPVKDTRQAKG